MPTQVHEVFVEMFRSHPELAAGLLADVFDIDLPDYRQARAASCDFTDVGPNEFRGDTALVFADGDGRPLLGIVLEVQLRRDRTRQWSWPVYLATLRARLRCPVYLMIFCPDRQVAIWSRQPIELGHPGLVLRPLVLGPDVIPAVTDTTIAESTPELAVLSALAHGDGPEPEKVFAALDAGLQKTDGDLEKIYYDVVLTLLSATARQRLEEFMMTVRTDYEYQSDFARKYVEEGREKGLAEGTRHSILMTLEVRGITLPDDAQARIEACSDLAELERWARRAITVESAAELFG